MFFLTFIFKWSTLLAVALFAPVSLPAGGAQLIKNTIISSNTCGISYIPVRKCFVRSQPLQKAYALHYVPLGMPIRVVRSWQNIYGENWLHVMVPSSNLFGSRVRGWIKI